MKKFLIIAAAALGLAATSGFVHAEEIIYSTDGAFTANTSGGIVTTVPEAITFGSGLNTTTLTFAPTAQDVFDPVTGTLGAFSVSSTGTGATAGDGSATFELTITQTMPSSGSGSTGGTVTDHFGGAITFNSGGFLIKLDPTSLNINTVTYKLDNLQGASNDQLAVGGPNTSVSADISSASVPLPAAAWGGMGLIGLLGASKARARRNMNG